MGMYLYRAIDSLGDTVDADATLGHHFCAGSSRTPDTRERTAGSPIGRNDGP